MGTRFQRCHADARDRARRRPAGARGAGDGNAIAAGRRDLKKGAVECGKQHFFKPCRPAQVEAPERPLGGNFIFPIQASKGACAWIALTGVCNATNPECSPYFLTVVPEKSFRLRIGSLTSLSALSFEIEVINPNRF